MSQLKRTFVFKYPTSGIGPSEFKKSNLIQLGRNLICDYATRAKLVPPESVWKDHISRYLLIKLNSLCGIEKCHKGTQ